MADILGYRTVSITEVEAFSFDWSDKLGEEQITGSSWVITPKDPSDGLEVTDPEYTINQTSVYVSGFAFAVDYQLTNTITTDGDRQLVRSFTLRATLK